MQPAATLSASSLQPAGTIGLRGIGRGALPTVVLLYLLTVALPIGFNLGSLYMTTMRALLLVTVVPTFFLLVSGKHGRIIATDVFFVLHVMWMTVAVAINNPNEVVQNVGSTAVEFMGGYLLGRVFIRTREQFAALGRALFWVVIFTLPFAVQETLSGRSFVLDLIDKMPFLRSYEDVHDAPRLGFERVQSVFPHPILYGLFSTIAFSLCFVGFKGLFSPLRRYAFSAVIAFCILLSLSSGAILALLLQLGLIFWAWAFRNLRFRWWLLVGFFVLAYVGIDLLSSRSPVKVLMTYATFSSHNAYWREAIFDYGMENVWANPIFGLGLRDWTRPYWMYSSSVDNFWLLMAMRYGIPGFLFVTLGYIGLIWRVGRRRLGDDRMLVQFRLAWMFTFLGLSFTLATVHIWSSVYSFVFFMFGAGAWIADSPLDSGASLAAGPQSPARAQRRPPMARGGFRSPEAGAQPEDEMPKFGHNLKEVSPQGADITSANPGTAALTRFPHTHSRRQRGETQG